MKTTNELIERLQERFIELEKLTRMNLKMEEHEKELHHWKNAKLYSECANEYNAEQREIIRVYAFIKEIEFVDACSELYDYFILRS